MPRLALDGAGLPGVHVHLQPLPAAYFAWLPLLLAGYMASVQGMKALWSRRYGWG